jgi:hypothetical protein
MSDEAGHSIGARIDERLAALFRELCRKELLDERKTEELVSQATSRPAATRPHSGRAPAPALARAALQEDAGSPHSHRQRLRHVASGRHQGSLRSTFARARGRLWDAVWTGWRAALRRT